MNTPYPIEGTVKTRSKTVTGYDLPCDSTWLHQHESGDLLDQVKNDVRVKHGVGVAADVIVYESGRHEILETRELDEDEMMDEVEA